VPVADLQNIREHGKCAQLALIVARFISAAAVSHLHGGRLLKGSCRSRSRGANGDEAKAGNRFLLCNAALLKGERSRRKGSNRRGKLAVIILFCAAIGP
jgi:hypothetical protein